jgi:hypothetical protein
MKGGLAQRIYSYDSPSGKELDREIHGKHERNYKFGI